MRGIKAEHFKKNYHDHLELPRNQLEMVHFAGHEIDANKYFQLKYFLSDKDKLEVVK